MLLSWKCKLVKKLRSRDQTQLQDLIRTYLAQVRVACRGCSHRRMREQLAELDGLERAIEQRVAKTGSAPRPIRDDRDFRHWEELAHQSEYQLSRIAELRGVSLRQMQRIFKQALNCCPRRWLRDLRCRKAKELIERGYSSKAAAAELKFATEAHFCREFKKVFGVSPQHFAPARAPVLPPLPQPFAAL
jgi:AraC-like DNA-binding protein